MFFGGGKKSNAPQPPPKTDNKNQESKIPHKSSNSNEHRSSKSIDSLNNDINASIIVLIKYRPNEKKIRSE